MENIQEMMKKFKIAQCYIIILMTLHKILVFVYSHIIVLDLDIYIKMIRRNIIVLKIVIVVIIIIFLWVSYIVQMEIKQIAIKYFKIICMILHFSKMEIIILVFNWIKCGQKIKVDYYLHRIFQNVQLTMIYHFLYIVNK